MTRAALAMSTALAAVLMTTAGADAQSRRTGKPERVASAVQACSNYGHGCTSAPVRRSPVGDELRMPGGTWISCRQDCKTALREEVLDFWETLRERAGDNFD